MAIKRKVFPSTGIHQRKERAVELKGDDPESFRDAITLLDELRSESGKGPLAELGNLETAAKDFLKKYVDSDMGGFNETTQRDAASAGIDFVVSRHIEQTRPVLHAEFQKKLSQEKKREKTDRLRRFEQADDACKMLFFISVIRSQLGAGSAEQAVAYGISLGKTAERFKTRVFERNAWTGDLVLRGAAKGGAHRRDRYYLELAATFRASKLSERRFAQVKGGAPRSTVQRAKRRSKKLAPPLSK